ncbi:hypothetical protein HPB51_025780 [Rhipicephalus microplus]|uniref:Uncharacterized protein n=1 Tax=Rhipicephalus microplus TaxID=6941 RepID=A0A9J6EJS8_RHIMP|nr:hypothetical protein HPB51_025780 [Rhipicephalus microplus]
MLPTLTHLNVFERDVATTLPLRCQVVSSLGDDPNTVKGVIRGTPLEDTTQEIQDLVVHRHHPTTSQVNRIGKTRSVVIIFKGHKVANYVR